MTGYVAAAGGSEEITMQHALKTLKMELLGRREPQYALAARAGMSETRLSRIVQGRLQPTPAERQRIAEALGIPEADLFPTAAA